MKKIMITLLILIILSGCNQNTVDYNKLAKEKIENAYILYNAFYGVGLDKAIGIDYIDQGENRYFLVVNDKIKTIIDIKELIDNTFMEDIKEEYYKQFTKSDSIYKMIKNKLYSAYLGGCNLEEYDKDKVSVVKTTSKTIVVKYGEKVATLYKDNKDYYFKENIIECDKNE